jgi:hypothetical protein
MEGSKRRGRHATLEKRIVFDDVAITMHNRFEKHDSVHRDVVYSGLSLGTSSIWKTLCLCIARTFSSIFVGGWKLQTFAFLIKRTITRYVATNEYIVYDTGQIHNL